MTSIIEASKKVVNILRAFLHRVENINLGWSRILFLAVLIVGVRITLEVTLSSRLRPHIIMDIIFFESWFLALFFSLVIFISYVSRKSALRVGRAILFGLPIILIPIIGLWQGRVRSFVWPKDSWSELAYHVVTFLWFHPSYGVFFTIEIFIFLAAIFIYLLLNISFVRAALGALGAYGILIFFALYGKNFGYLYTALSITNLSNTQFYTLIDLIILLGIAFLIFLQEKPIQAKALFFHFRPHRVLFGIALSAMMLVGALFAPQFYFFNFLCSFIFFNFFLFYAAISNDLVDNKIDAISNPTRPYVSGVISKKEMIGLKNFSLAVLFVFAVVLQSFPLAFLILFNVFLSVLYSPLRLRKYFFAFIIAALGESFIVLFGYFGQLSSYAVLSTDALYFFIAFFLLLCFFLPIKDLKDGDGDRVAGVRNIPTVFGWNKAKAIISIMVFFGYVGFALMAWGSIYAVLAFLPAGLLSSFFVLKYEKFGEQPLYFIFLASALSILLTFMI